MLLAYMYFATYESFTLLSSSLLVVWHHLPAGFPPITSPSFTTSSGMANYQQLQSSMHMFADLAGHHGSSVINSLAKPHFGPQLPAATQVLPSMPHVMSTSHLAAASHQPQAHGSSVINSLAKPHFGLQLPAATQVLPSMSHVMSTSQSLAATSHPLQAHGMLSHQLQAQGMSSHQLQGHGTLSHQLQAHGMSSHQMNSTMFTHQLHDDSTSNHQLHDHITSSQAVSSLPLALPSPLHMHELPSRCRQTTLL